MGRRAARRRARHRAPPSSRSTDLDRRATRSEPDATASSACLADACGAARSWASSASSAPAAGALVQARLRRLAGPRRGSVRLSTRHVIGGLDAHRAAVARGHRAHVPGPARDRCVADAVDRRQHRAREPRPRSPGGASSTWSASGPIAARPDGGAAHPRADRSTRRVRSLSGGNQQKVQVARWLTARVTRVLLLDDPDPRRRRRRAGRDPRAPARDLADGGLRACSGCRRTPRSSSRCADRILVMRARPHRRRGLPAAEATEARLLARGGRRMSDAVRTVGVQAARRPAVGARHDARLRRLVSLRNYTLSRSLIVTWVVFAGLTNGIFLTPAQPDPDGAPDAPSPRSRRSAPCMLIVTRNFDISVGLGGRARRRRRRLADRRSGDRPAARGAASPSSSGSPWVPGTAGG